MVPEDRVPAFYRWFGEWLSGKNDEGGEQATPAAVHWLDAPDAAERASSAWNAMTLPARSVISVFVDSPGQPLTSEAVVDVLGHDKGVHGLAGVLGGAGRAFNKFGIPDAWKWDGTYYWMDPRIAALLATSRESAGRA